MPTTFLTFKCASIEWRVLEGHRDIDTNYYKKPPNNLLIKQVITGKNE